LEAKVKGSSMTQYLVTGATGQLGRLVIDHLVKLVPTADVVALIRKESDAAEFAAKGVATRIGDYDNPASLEAALAGIDRVLLISSPTIGQRVPQHKALIDAAKVAGVSFIAYTSLLGGPANPMQIAAEHGATEGCWRRAASPPRSCATPGIWKTS
jgi:NAD(P)H dehydrogenase (quinone)